MQLFRKSVSGSCKVEAEPRPREISNRLTELMDALAASGASQAEEQQQLRKTASEGVLIQLRSVLDVFKDDGAVASAASKGRQPEASPNTTASSKAAAGYSPVATASAPSDSSQSVVASASSSGKLAGVAGEEAATAGTLFLQLLAANIPTRLVENLDNLEFEVRKDVISVLSAIVRLGPVLGMDLQLGEYALAQPRFFELLVEGHANPEIATHCGMILRSCARHRGLVEAFLSRTEVALRLLAITRHASFDVSSDAFSSLHDLILTHKAVSVTFLDTNFLEFFRQYNELLQTDDYVTQRQALKLLSEVLLDRTFMRVMLAYIGDEQFLQIHMNLLRADSKAIQFEAFHVFKIFVANPQKPPRVQQILYKNRERLVKLLETLRAGRPDDRQFAEDRAAVVEKLQALEPAPVAAAPSAVPKTPAIPTLAPMPEEKEKEKEEDSCSGEKASGA